RAADIFDLPRIPAAVGDGNFFLSGRPLVDVPKGDGARLEIDVVVNVAGDCELDFGVEGLVNDDFNRRVSLAGVAAGIEGGDDGPFFPVFERVLGYRRRGAAATCGDVGDVDVFEVGVGNLE